MPNRKASTRRLAPNATLHRRGSRTQASGPRRSEGTLSQSPALGTFRSDCDAAIAAIGSAVRALCAAVGADPLRPQDVARAFRINKNLTWKFARVLLAEDSFDAIAMLPGPEGIEIYLRAFADAGAPADAVDALRGAALAFEEVVVRHVGSRAELELVLDGLRRDAQLEASRRLAFRGLSGIVGMQARARVAAQFVVPTQGKPGYSDVAIVAGLAGMRQLRPIGTLPVFRTRNEASGGIRSEPLLPSPDGGCGYLLGEFSSFPNATVRNSIAGDRLVVEIQNGAVGRTGDSDLFFGSVVRGGMCNVRRPGDDFVELLTAVNLPSEHLVSDVFVHRSIPFDGSLTTALHSTVSAPVPEDPSKRDTTRLPIDCGAVVLDDVAGALDVPVVPQYRAMIERILASEGRSADEFRLIRVAMEYPPVPASLVVRWELPAG